MRTKLASVVAFVAFVACALALAGCGADYDHTDITNVKGSPPFQGSMNYARIVVPVGMLVTAHVVSFGDDRKTMSTGIQSKDPHVLEVAGVVTPDDYAFLGLTPGTTDVEISADGRVVLIVTAVVTNQPTLP